MQTDAETTLKQLADKQAILELIYLYCRGLDRLDEATLRSIYHEDAYEDRGEGLFMGSAYDMAAQALDQLRRGFTASQHFIGNVLIELEGDVAHGESYFQAYHRFADRPGRPPTELIMAGRYLDRFERRAGVWKIAHRQMVNDWSRTQAVNAPWLERFPGAYRGVRDISGARLSARNA